MRLCFFLPLALVVSLGSPQSPTVAAGAFHACPPAGRTTLAKVRALNVLKNRARMPSHITASITAAAIVAPGDDTDRFSTDDAVTIRVFVTVVKPGDAESCNCGATAIADTDTHIEWNAVGPHYRGLPAIAEVTPRWRAAMQAVGVDWSTPTLRQTVVGHWVTITGYLFRDDEHLQNATNTNPKGTNLWRQTVIEVHPITGLRVDEWRPTVTLQCIPCGRSVTLWTIPTPAPSCEYCGARDWRNVDEPAREYALTVNDKRFLKQMLIDPDG